jgi:hypothetical protein
MRNFKVSDQRKQAKMQWIQDPTQSNVDNLKNVRREASRHFSDKKKEYMKAKVNEVKANSLFKNIRGLYRGIIDINTQRTVSFKLFKHPFPGFLTILTI